MGRQHSRDRPSEQAARALWPGGIGAGPDQPHDNARPLQEEFGGSENNHEHQREACEQNFHARDRRMLVTGEVRVEKFVEVAKL